MPAYGSRRRPDTRWVLTTVPSASTAQIRCCATRVHDAAATPELAGRHDGRRHGGRRPCGAARRQACAGAGARPDPERACRSPGRRCRRRRARWPACHALTALTPSTPRTWSSGPMKLQPRAARIWSAHERRRRLGDARACTVGPRTGTSARRRRCRGGQPLAASRAGRATSAGDRAPDRCGAVVPSRCGRGDLGRPSGASSTAAAGVVAGRSASGRAPRAPAVVVGVSRWAGSRWWRPPGGPGDRRGRSCRIRAVDAGGANAAGRDEFEPPGRPSPDSGVGDLPRSVLTWRRTLLDARERR